MSPLVSIIIVNWNSKENLQECLSALLKISYENYEVILVDNGSEDDSVKFVKSKYPTVKVIESDKNLGFAGGNNLGFEKARGKYILFLNNDTIVTKDFLRKLVDFMEKRNDVGIIQPKILFHRPGTSLHHKINSIGSFLLRSGFLYHLDYGQKDKERKEPYRIFSAYGACFLARKSLLDKIGLFDDRYFAYFEETDLCHRVWLSGLKVMILPDILIYHKGAKTAEKLPSAFIQFHSFKNRLYTYLKNFEGLNLIKIFIPHLIICEISSILYLILGKPSYTFAIQKAILWNLFNLKKLLKERKIIQKDLRKVKDKDFIPELSKTVGLKYYYYLSSGSLEKYRE
ncbi:MAG: Glycosyltransferase, group 2 family protein [Microgenomates group bacterium GW2011_GWA2_37_6]|nr:MAG: Glycosyltransferase, group 2 family protein [Microgenomates group bacterium GW2011_GWA2_37_6]